MQQISRLLWQRIFQLLCQKSQLLVPILSHINYIQILTYDFLQVFSYQSPSFHCYVLHSIISLHCFQLNTYLQQCFYVHINTEMVN
jgi:hypothetical protein